MTGMGERLHPRLRNFFIPPEGFTPETCRQLATLAFEILGAERRPALRALEDVPKFDQKPTEGTILQVVVDALNAMNQNHPTTSTVGAIREMLGMLPHQIHDAFCRCKNGTDMSGYQAAAHLKALDQPKPVLAQCRDGSLFYKSKHVKTKPDLLHLKCLQFHESTIFGPSGRSKYLAKKVKIRA